jgi:alpha-beta hydrolase superfamily lysophospholipase
MRTAAPPVLRQRPEVPCAAVLLLHGGREAGLARPPLWNSPALRMRPFATAIARALPDAVVCRARYRHRGWNGERADAAMDARTAVEWLTAEFGTLPTVLVGHSMGGRAALHAAGHPAVRGVVALAPWCPPQDPVGQLAGRRVALLHSDRDPVTDPEATWRFLTRAKAAGAETIGLEIPGSDHAMLRRAPVWHRLTVRLVRQQLSPAGVTAPTAPPATDCPDRPDRVLRMRTG